MKRICHGMSLASVLAIAALGLAPADTASAQQQSPGQEQTSAAAKRDISAMSKKELAGKQLYGADGKSLGRIEDVVQNAEGKTESVLIDVGGFFGIGAKRVAVPANLISVRDDKLLAQGLTREKTEKMPEYKEPGSESGKSMSGDRKSGSNY